MKVRKRNGKERGFDLTKIAKAIYKARIDANQDRTLEECIEEAKIIKETLPNGGSILSIEEIQDAIKLYFIKNGEIEVFKLFTFYREKRKHDRMFPWSDNDERQDMILSKYTIDKETKKEFIDRISIGSSDLAKIFRNKEGIWGGRNLYAIGREGNITGSNCYVATAPQDSLRDIFRADYEIARTYSYGGGQGLNLSNIRPAGAKVNNSSNTTPGVMNFADRYSYTTLKTQQEDRRGALMLVLNIDHPDVIDFITTKLDVNKINGANISLAITDKFMKAVENDDMWEMKFETPHEMIIKKVKAKELMNLIAYANHTVGDPGFLLMDEMNRWHLLSEYPEVEFNATNPCGEQPLMENGSCNLGSINLNAFVRKAHQDDAFFDLERFEEVVTHMTEGLDELLDIFATRHALPAQIEHVFQWREIGLGVMGLADLAISMKLEYGSPEFITVLDTIMESMANFAAQASAMRAREFGAFPKYNWDYISSSPFFKEVYTQETKDLIRTFGLRNSRLLSIAPTGSISNVIGVSGGVEPYFNLKYWREIQSMFSEKTYIEVFEKTPGQLAKRLGLAVTELDKLPDYAKVTSQNIDFNRRAEVQATIQKYVDTAISSTFNLNNSANVEDIINIYMTAWKKKFKGATVFRDNCEKIGILTEQGGGVATPDANHAPYPSITVYETWYNKDTMEEKHYVNHIQIEKSEYKSEKIEHEACPDCGSHLIKRGGCTKCSNDKCYYEKCAL